MKTEILRKIVLSSLVLLGLVSCVTSKKEVEKPNVVIIFTDDQGYGDVGVYGAKGFKTPHTDALAKEGLLLTDFYVAATVCTPSRAALLTGSYPKRIGLHDGVLFPFSTTGMAAEEYTVAEMLKESGYQTACIGKWHLGHQEVFMPNNQGFEYFYGVPYSNDMDNHKYGGKINFQSPPLPLMENTKQIASGPDQRYLTKMYTEASVKYIKEHKDEPFFLYLAHNMPHVPLHVSEKFDGISEDGLYGDVISEIDWSVGEVVKALKEEGLFENTIVIFSSDNGPHGKHRHEKGSSGPLRGTKATTWEGGQRVPGIISWPAQIPAGKVSNEVVTAMDIMPTLSQIVRGHHNFSQKIDGVNQLAFLKNPDEKIMEKPFLYYARNGDLEAIRLGDWKYHSKKSRGWDKSKEGDFKPALYNLRTDIGEQNNVIKTHADKAVELANLMQEIDENLAKEARAVGTIK